MALLSHALLRWYEEQQGSLSLLPFTLLLFFSVLFLLKLYGACSTEKSNLPPSPLKIPIIGNFHQIGTLAHQSFRDMSQKYGALMLLHLGQVPALVVSSPQMATEVMKNQDILFANRPFTTAGRALLYECTDVGFVPYGEYWREVRRNCILGLLSIKKVQSFKHVREQEVAVAMDKISSSRGDVINLTEMLLTLGNNIVCRCAFGAKYEEVHGNRFGELSREVMGLLGAFSYGDFFPYLRWMDIVTGLSGRLKRASKELDSFLEQVIEEHLLPKLHDHDQEKDKKQDLIDILLQVQKDNTYYTRQNIKAVVVDMFAGGTDTTATVTEWVMTELLKNPEVMKKAQVNVRRIVGKKTKVDEDDINQMDYLKCIIKESLRLHAPVPTLIPRQSYKSTKIEGYDIPPNTRVYINAWAIHRDPKLWDKPLEFRPERFINNGIDFKGQEFQFIPFGSGRRGCPGMSFGLAVVELVLANLLYRFDWELPAGANIDELDTTEALGLTVSKKFPLHVVPKFHSGS